MHSNKYTFLYAIGLSMLTAVILVLTSEQLKPLQEANVALDNKKSILKSVLLNADDEAYVLSTYDSSFEEIIINSQGELIEGVTSEDVDMKREVAKDVADRQLPLYIYTDENDAPAYVIPLRGNGLWGPIWGYISITDDFNTVKGAFFDHKGETPGLGAEIVELAFQDQFKGKLILDSNGEFASVNVMKTTIKSQLSEDNRVAAISGGTITSNGVDAMIKNCVEPYLTYFNKLKSN